ncbi:UNVERIFIED_CONTAM: hypothetical protein Sradi_2506600 [Sesamum radiatum]|uniref:Uncharacterized protein n=1 Tax=Sesamum radiatum TaxID=300843 RepID=A0AAW2SM60_SESRA
MASSNNGYDNRSFEGNISIPVAAGSAIPPPHQVLGGLNAPDLAFDATAIVVAINSLRCSSENS